MADDSKISATSSHWTANDPDELIRNGMDGGIEWMGNWRT